MRLINIHTLKFGEFFDQDVPPYAILSHRWGPGEITYKDFLKRRNPESAGFKKVVDFCDFVRRLECRIFDNDSWRIQWVWVDTCCIDKKSSAELSEAINSMYGYYARSVLCVVYLGDLECFAGETMQHSLRRCQWFRRAWTLQELIAPGLRLFCDELWNIRGHILGSTPYETRKDLTLKVLKPPMIDSLLDEVSAITRVPVKLLTKSTWVQSYTVAQKMSWASRRKSTRSEDIAYCMLGLFNINMPLIYGEGRKAFQRLQEEIIRTNPDQSLLAWVATRPQDVSGYALASGPEVFADCSDVVSDHRAELSAFAVTNVGLEMNSDLWVKSDRSGIKTYSLQLNCARKTNHQSGHRETLTINLEELKVLRTKNRRTFRTVSGRDESTLDFKKHPMKAPFYIIDSQLRLYHFLDPKLRT